MKFKQLSVFAILLILNYNHVFSQKKQQPNVVLIVIDDLNDYTGFLGGHPQVKTPNMDALAKNGLVFTNAHANAPICGPSRASMLTGIYPHTSQNFWFDNWTENYILKNVKTLPHFLRDHGYNAFGTGKLMHQRVKSEWTAYGVENTFGPYAFNGKKVVQHPAMPKEYSQDKNDGLFTSLANVPNVAADDKFPGFKGWYDQKNRKQFKYINDDDRDLLSDEQSANWAVQKIDSLKTHKIEKPFFLSVGFVRPHTPLVAPQKYFDLYPLETLKIPVIKKNDAADTFYKSSFKWTPPWAQHFQELEKSYATIEEGLRKYVQAYLACVSFVDAQVGTVLKALKNSDFHKNTIVILVSDHGYNLGEKDFLYKNTLWEESTKIPFIISHPKYAKSKGKIIENPVSLIDVFPTIADFTDSKSSNLKNNKGKKLDGFSLKPFLENPENPKWNGPEVALTVVRGNSKSNDSKEQSYAVRSKNFRYIYYVNGKEELYDHKKDPYEWENLAYKKEYSKIKKGLKKQLDNLLKLNN